ncbi:mechanosensitive ion channel protein MscS [Nitrosopumilus oxyclinae]|uniref:Mechanosensitive ion channel protein MscS n=1 Tax=Nitrosopumilus oxyclinae TaxID=1959104 RepID=A0A7D5R4F0_9ARCH|nr:mechanosensitive ion channel domain-containing protein [Nitrosopumilus oxyclinae]QLH05457.1 mechanosensitive ion channel protein MscS [Nitrosopumilus oxyclinae]
MAEDEIIGAVAGQASEFQSVTELIASSEALQIAFTVLVIGIIGITLVYRVFSKWVLSQKFSYVRPHLSRFVRVGVLPFFAIILITSMNAYIQSFDLFDNVIIPDLQNNLSDMPENFVVSDNLSSAGTFAKILNTINILVIGYSIAHLIPIIISKREKSNLEKEDFESWKDMRGFLDDKNDLFHRCFQWVPPKNTPEDISDEEFLKNLKTEDGRKFLEEFRTTKGLPIGSYQQLVKNPFGEWKQSEREKYLDYFEKCISGNNQSGKKLRLGQSDEEIYPIDTWREEKRLESYEPIVAGGRPPGYATRKRKNLPKSISQILPLGIFVAVIIGVVSWWGVDLFVLATATGGLAIGVGLALQETMQNYFAYILIRKDKIFAEGERIKLDTGYNGYVHKITPRVTYIRDALNESFAVIPTRQLVNAQIINFSKEIKMVPAMVKVGVSYLNDPKQVSAILVKVGKRVMKESVDSKGRHLVTQLRCPYVEENKPSCGCDKDIHVDINQPVVRFNNFNDSSLDFSLWLYVRDYGSQFKAKTEMRIIMYEEFKKYDIRIPWPIRTVYQGDEKREQEEIDQLSEQRDGVIDEYGIGDIGRGSGEE